MRTLLLVIGNLFAICEEGHCAEMLTLRSVCAKGDVARETTKTRR
jgi:hypothetical protein